MMYSTFNSLGDLLAYCCYRGDSRWFEIVNNLIVQSSLPNRTSLMKQSLELRQLYFKNPEIVTDDKRKVDHNPLTFFGNAVPHNQLDVNEENHNILLAIYPLFLKLSPELIRSNIDKKIMESARHSLTLHSPFRCLTHLMKIKGEVNIITHIFINLIRELKENPSSSVYDSFKELHHILYSDRDLFKAEYYGKWDLSISQSVRVLKLISDEQSSSLSRLLACLQKKCEPMQTIIGGIFHEDFSEGNMDEDKVSFSM